MPPGLRSRPGPPGTTQGPHDLPRTQHRVKQKKRLTFREIHGRLPLVRLIRSRAQGCIKSGPRTGSMLASIALGLTRSSLVNNRPRDNCQRKNSIFTFAHGQILKCTHDCNRRACRVRASVRLTIHVVEFPARARRFPDIVKNFSNRASGLLTCEMGRV